MRAIDQYMDDFSSFIEASPSSYHAARAVADRLGECGFTELVETEEWSSKPGGYFVIRDGAVIAWIMPAKNPIRAGFRILGAHTDSPGFKLKPNPSITSQGWLQAGVEVYGGPLLNSWLDRDLELAGRLALRDGSMRLVRTGAMLRIPQLAIHLDREVNDGLRLDRQQHLQPIWGVGTSGDVVAVLAEMAGVSREDVAGWDVLTAGTQPAQRLGHDGELFAAGRMDNLSSVFAATVALEAVQEELTGEESFPIPVLAAFDHEELGSQSRSGASGPFLSDVLTRICEASGASTSEQLRSYAASWCLSADAGHAVHPNYPERHDPITRPYPGGGTLLKINANQRYTTDAGGMALVERLAQASGTKVQPFVSNNTVPCGSTIGPLTATRLGIRTVDIGVPLLSMHSARELVHCQDACGLSELTKAFLLDS